MFHSVWLRVKVQCLVGVLMELMQTQEQPVVLSEAIQGVFGKAAADSAAQTAQSGEERGPEDGKKRKASAAFDLSGEEAVLKVPLEGQALASLAALLRTYVADRPTEVHFFPPSSFSAHLTILALQTHKAISSCLEVLFMSQSMG